MAHGFSELMYYTVFHHKNSHYKMYLDSSKTIGPTSLILKY